jgi:hypothetical protein
MHKGLDGTSCFGVVVSLGRHRSRAAPSEGSVFQRLTELACPQEPPQNRGQITSEARATTIRSMRTIVDTFACGSAALSCGLGFSWAHRRLSQRVHRGPHSGHVEVTHCPFLCGTNHSLQPNVISSHSTRPSRRERCERETLVFLVGLPC